MTTMEPSLVTPAGHVVDISHHNSDVDFHQLQAAGAIAVIAKATQGTGYVDDRFDEYQKRVAQVSGLLFMTYHFLDGSNVEDQIRHYVTVTQGVKGRVLDFEHNKSELNEPLAEMGWNFLADKQGRAPMTYGSDLVTQAILTNTNCAFRHGPLWIARYNPHQPVLAHGVEWDLWQYTEHGQIDGATDDIDLSVHRSGDHAQATAFLTQFAL